MNTNEIAIATNEMPTIPATTMAGIGSFRAVTDIITPEIAFTVDRAAVRNDFTGKTIPKVFANYRTDTGESIGIVKSRYKIFQHTEILSAFQNNYLSKIDRTYIVKHYVNKGRILSKVMFPAHGTGIEKNQALFCLNIKNSYDGSGKLELSGEIVRLICLNGMTRSLYKIGSMVVSHCIRNRVDNNVIDHVYETMAVAKNEYVMLVEGLSARPIVPREQLPESIFPKRLIKRAEETYPIEYGITGKNNAFTQYQSYTRYLSHAPIDQNRVTEKIGQITDFFYNVAIAV